MSWWIDPKVKPMIPGIYRVRLPYAPHVAFARWNGVIWLCWGTTEALAERVTFPGPKNGYDWRAITALPDRFRARTA